MSDQLSVGMSVMLRQIAAGVQPDGRSWRSAEGLRRRGLIAIEGGRWSLTEAGWAEVGVGE